MRKKLGKGLSDMGLDVLLSGVDGSVATSVAASAGELLQQLPVDLLKPSQYQPRQSMDPVALQELADSIQAQGVIQPIIARRRNGGYYEIIAGERRWRAAQLAQLHEVPVVVRELSDEATMVMALIENLQRQDLNAIEEAVALHRLMTEFKMTHEEVAKSVGKSRSAISNMVRLLNLETTARAFLADGKIEMGHARALLALEGEQQSRVANEIVTKDLSVRQAEERVKQLKAGNEARSAPVLKDPDVLALQARLSDQLGAVVGIQQYKGGRGKLVIYFHSADELEGILEHIQ